MALTMDYIGLQEKFAKPKVKKIKSSKPKKDNTPKPKKNKVDKIKELINKHKHKIETYRAKIAKHEKHIKRLEKSLSEFGSMSYAELLNRKEWKQRRNEIFKLKGKVCSKCGSTTNLHVHHLYYKKECLPWEYPDDALIVLCEDCHKEAHGIKQEETS